MTTSHSNRGSEGIKFDQDKIPLELLPFDGLIEVAKVLQFGAKKYAPRNWELGMNWSRVFGACLRHLWARFLGEKVDSETGLSHLAHAATCILFLLTWELRDVGTNDFPYEL